MSDIRESEIRPSPAASGGTTDEARQRASAAADQATTVAADVKDEAAGAAAGLKQQAGSEISALTGEAKQQARNLASDAKGRLDSQVEDGTRRLAGTISAAAQELRQMADRSDQPDGTATEVVRQLASRAEDIAGRLENGGYRAVANDVARLGRNRPGLFLLAAGAAGFAVGRILRNVDTSALAEAVKDEVKPEDTQPSASGSGFSDVAAAEVVIVPEPAYAGSPAQPVSGLRPPEA